MSSRRQRKWTREEDQLLEWMWQEHSPAEIAMELERTPRAIKERAHILGLGSARGYSKTIEQIATETGYYRKRIEAVIERLGLKVQRLNRGDPRNDGVRYSWFIVTPEQEQQILDFLASYPDGKRVSRAVRHGWGGKKRDGSNKAPCCVECYRNDVPYWAKNRCSRCYQRLNARERRKRRAG